MLVLLREYFWLTIYLWSVFCISWRSDLQCRAVVAKEINKSSRVPAKENRYFASDEFLQLAQLEYNKSIWRWKSDLPKRTSRENYFRRKKKNELCIKPAVVIKLLYSNLPNEWTKKEKKKRKRWKEPKEWKCLSFFLFFVLFETKADVLIDMKARPSDDTFWLYQRNC